MVRGPLMREIVSSYFNPEQPEKNSHIRFQITKRREPGAIGALIIREKRNTYPRPRISNKIIETLVNFPRDAPLPSAYRSIKLNLG